MTPDAIEPGSRVWSHRKGFFNDEDVKRLEAIAGSLTVGLHMPTRVLPRSSSPTNNQPLRQVNPGKSRSTQYDPALFEGGEGHACRVWRFTTVGNRILNGQR